jgi:hypothetical protein
MKNRVQVLSLQTSTPDTISLRKVNESILDFARREIDNRQGRLIAALRAALTELKDRSFRPQVTFFTAPELYWNIPWEAVKNKEELHQLCLFYKQVIQKRVRAIIRDFPVSKWGKLVLLPGTNALLIPSKKNAKRYESFNHVLAANNFGRGFLWGPPYLSIWPKRNTGMIDFLGVSVQQAVELDGELVIFDPETVDPDLFEGDPAQVFVYQLSKTLKIDVYELSTQKAKHQIGCRSAPLFDNQIVPGLPFGIDICADLGLERVDELKQPEVKLDFLIAAGQPVPSDFPLRESVQYLIRNDGKSGLTAGGTQRSQCEVWSVINGQTHETVPGQLLSAEVWLHQFEVQ